MTSSPTSPAGDGPRLPVDWVFAASNGFAHRVGELEELHQLLAAALQAPAGAGLEWVQVQHAVHQGVYLAFDVVEVHPERSASSDSATEHPASDSTGETGAEPGEGQRKWRASADESTLPALGEAAGAALTSEEAARIARQAL